MTIALPPARSYLRVYRTGAYSAYEVSVEGAVLGVVACEQHAGPWWAEVPGGAEEYPFTSRREAADWLEEVTRG